MKKDIAVIREAIKKVVALLTKRSIKVTQRGSKAYVEYNAKTGAINLVNLPYLPDDASDEFVAAVQGFLDHEVGHVLYTDPKIMPVMRKESGKVKNLANAIEDVYIERKMGEAFAGSIGNLNSVRKFYLEKIAKPKIEQAIAAGDLKTAAGYASLVQFRAWGGQQMAADFLRDNPNYAELVKPMAERLGEELIAKIKKASNSWDCLDLARDMKKALEEPPQDGEGKGDDSGESSKATKGKGDKSEKPSEPDDTPPEDNPDEDFEENEDPADDEGSTHAETDDSGKEREERSETEEKADEPESGEVRGGDDEPADQEDPEYTDHEEGRSKEDPPEADHDDTSTDDQPEGEVDEGDDPEGAEVGEGEPAADDADEAEDLGDDPTGGESDEGTPDEEGADEAMGGKGGGSGEEGADAEDHADEASEVDADLSEADEEPHEDLSELFDQERDFDDEMSRELTKTAVKEIQEADYQIFSTDWDQIEMGRKAAREASIEKMVDKTEHMVSSIQKGLERAIAAKARKTWNPGQRRGRIAPGALFKTAVGDDRVFRTRYETQAKNTAVSLLVDCSGSMSWSGKIETAAMAAYALSSTLERLKITHEVLGFTTRVNRAMKYAMDSEGLGVRYARQEALYIPVLKGFNERLTVDAKSRIAHLTEYECHDWLRENVDGESLQIAARRLKAQRAERHLLIVLSDGSPACSGDWMQLNSHLKHVAKTLDTDSGVEVVGIGILDDSVKSYYDKHVVLSDLNELPTTVVAQLSKVLLAN
jgi:cobalamin biosynthesis protein CobT